MNLLSGAEEKGRLSFREKSEFCLKVKRVRGRRFEYRFCSLEFAFSGIMVGRTFCMRGLRDSEGG